MKNTAPYLPTTLKAFPSLIVVCLLMAIVSIASTRVAMGQRWQIEVPEEWNFLSVSAISADGHTVVGSGGIGKDKYSVVGGNAFRWNLESGLRILEDDSDGFYGSQATAVSANGQFIGGRVGVENAHKSKKYQGPMSVPFLWSEDTGTINLGTFERPSPHGGYSVSGISADGSVIVGVGTTNYRLGITYNVAFIWTETEGMRVFPGRRFPKRSPFPSQALISISGITADGSTWAGNCMKGKAFGRHDFFGYVYTDKDEFIRMESPKEWNLPYTNISAISSDGSIVVGVAWNQKGGGMIKDPKKLGRSTFVWERGKGMRKGKRMTTDYVIPNPRWTGTLDERFWLGSLDEKGGPASYPPHGTAVVWIGDSEPITVERIFRILGIQATGHHFMHTNVISENGVTVVISKSPAGIEDYWVIDLNALLEPDSIVK